MKRNRGRTKQIILLVISIEVLFIIAWITYLQYMPMVVETVSMEAGTQMVDVKEFLLNKKRHGSYITDINNLDLNTPGAYEVQIKVGRRIHRSTLEVIDTTPPQATAVDQIVLLHEKITADAFVSDIIDAEKVKVSYEKTPDFSKTGDQSVIIKLEDESGNTRELSAILTVLDIKNSVTVEAGTVIDVDISDFIVNEKYQASILTDLSKLDISKPTTYKINLNVNGREVTSNILVVDTTAPKATMVDHEIWNDETPPAVSFVKDISDVSSVQVSYETPPDFTKPGEQEVSLVIEDESGNKTRGTAKVTVKADTEAPVITGAADKFVYIGDSVSYKKGISAKDNKDASVTVKVNSSKVNMKKEGTYPVIYTATDQAGNSATVSIKVNVSKLIISEKELNKLADGILAKIVKDSMTKKEKAFAIYRWVKSHIGYNGYSDKTDWLAEAYRGIKNGVGDCFTYYAVSQALLTRAGIDNMRVTRVGGRTHHFWNLINCGDGWYHFDACPNKDHLESFMLTDQEVADLTKKRGNNYYVFDTSLYPATPEK